MEEVFESSDIEENIENVDQEQNDINVKESRSKFSDVDVINDTFDFSGNIVNSSGYYIKEVEETKEEKLIRIEKELNEFNQEDPKVIQLIELLNNFKKRPEAERVKLEKDPLDLTPPSQPSKRDLKTIVELDNKLSKLEDLLDDCDSPIQSQLNDMKRKIAIIDNPEFNLNKIKEELKSINIPKSTDFDFDIFKVPISRLKSLNQVYHDMENNINLSNNIDELIHNLKDDLIKWDDSIITLNDKLSQFEQNHKCNIDSVTNEIKKITEKFPR